MEVAETVHRRPLRLPPAVPHFPAAAGVRPIGGFLLPLKVTAVSGAALAPPVPVWQTRPSRPTTRRLRVSAPRGATASSARPDSAYHPLSGASLEIPPVLGVLGTARIDASASCSTATGRQFP